MEITTYCKSQLKERGWTDSMIRKFMPVPDAEKTNPIFRCASPMKLFNCERVHLFEDTDEWMTAREKADTRSKVARNVAERKRDDLLKEAESLSIDIKIIPMDKVIKNAISHYNRWQRERNSYASSAHIDSDHSFLERISVNYLRHEKTNYDFELYKLRRRVGVHEAYFIVKTKVLNVIKESYPTLGDECDRQLEQM